MGTRSSTFDLMDILDPDLMNREAKNVDELLAQMPMDGEVVVKIGEHLALRVYVEHGIKHVETMYFVGEDPYCVMMPLTHAQAMKLVAALSA
jgi:hypothetical protein